MLAVLLHAGIRGASALDIARDLSTKHRSIFRVAQALGGVQSAHCGIGPANAMPDVDIKNEFEEAVLPVARLLGHALAAALGFCALGLISLIPIVVVRLLLWLDFAELAGPLRVLEAVLLFADIALFAAVLFAGIAVFAVEIISAAWRRIEVVPKETGHNE